MASLRTLLSARRLTRRQPRRFIAGCPCPTGLTLARALGALACLLVLATAEPCRAQNGFLQMTNGYFWDPVSQDYFIPRGVAYQIWNPPVGANQSLAQVNYDLTEFKKLRANSVRAELTWSQIEVGPNQYDWSKADYLVNRAEQLGLKLFLIIGYQYPPSWLPVYYRGINNLGLRTDVVKCLANSWPSNALACLPSQTAAALQAANSAATLSRVLDCLVTGARTGGVSNILSLLQSTLTPEELTANLPYLVSDVINYEDPQAREAYRRYISAVTGHYRNSPAIGGWILGNEYAYFDLWEDPTIYSVHRFLGYDALSQQNFRGFLRSLYHTNLAALNANWRTNYLDFDSVVMPVEYPSDRYYPGFQDLIQWRKQSIGNFVALGALAARQADPNHLCTYSMVGGLFNGRDANFTCEDAKTIVGCCVAAGAPLDFWSINNYAWASQGSEIRSAAFGIEKYQDESGLPVMISETGHSSTENLFDYDPVTGVSYAGARQPAALPSTMWESLLCGAIGVHFFTWNDRNLYTPDSPFYRERGFGIVQENRLPKHEVYATMETMFRQMDNLHVERLLGGSSNAPADVQFFWSTNADMVWPRANQENAMIWGALKRLGFQSRIIDDAAFERGAFTNAPVLMLSRCYQMDPHHLYELVTNVLPAGIHIHAQADLPGQFDAYCRTNADWPLLMQNLFGIDVRNASPGFDLIVTRDCYSPLRLHGIAALAPITSAFAADLTTWKMWRRIASVSAKVILTDYGFSNLPNIDCPYVDPLPYPALFVNSAGSGLGNTAVNPFALGDVGNWSSPPSSRWDTRYAILRSIYRTHFGLTPKIELSGPGSDRVIAAYRTCSNGGVLISLLNEDTNSAVLTLSSPAVLSGRKVEDLTFGGILTTNSNGLLTYTNLGDNCAILYAYSTDGRRDTSLVNTNPNKFWFQEAPRAIWSGTVPFDVTLGYDTSESNLSLVVTLEQTWPQTRVCAESSVSTIAGQGTLVATVPVPDSDPNNPLDISSREGGEYVLRAVLLKNGGPISDVSLPVRYLFGVHPLQPLPISPVPGKSYAVDLAWEELPSYLSGFEVPLDRAAVWDSASLGQEHYRVVLELKAGSLTVSSNSFLTSTGTGTNTITVRVPSGALGPFHWEAYLETATNVLSHNVSESFEGFTRGANWQGPGLPYLTNNFLAPWASYTYSWPPATAGTDPTNLFLNQGIQLLGIEGSQSAFMVVTNPAWAELGGFGMFYEFPGGDWALPSNHNLWSNYVFSYQFQESHGYACSVEMQVKNLDPMNQGKWIQYTNLYPAGATGWFTCKATLDQFAPPPDLPGPFERDKVHAIVVNLRMLTTNVQYVASFDNIQFRGPEVDLGGGARLSAYTSADDVAGWLWIQTLPTALQLSWQGNGVLQSAPKLTGPWADLTNASNPLLINQAVSNRFYRLRR